MRPSPRVHQRRRYQGMDGWMPRACSCRGRRRACLQTPGQERPWDHRFPAIETALIDGDVAFRQHSGGHTAAPNWPTFLTLPNVPQGLSLCGRERSAIVARRPSTSPPLSNPPGWSSPQRPAYRCECSPKLREAWASMCSMTQEAYTLSDQRRWICRGDANGTLDAAAKTIQVDSIKRRSRGTASDYCRPALGRIGDKPLR